MRDDDMIGHAEAWAAWRAATAGARMHHAWILAGPKGVGKGAFARAAAAELVAEAGVPQPPPYLHPDIIIPEHPPENKEETAKREAGQEYRRKRAIPVDEIRGLQRRLNTRPTLGARRVVIIDPADDLEKAAVNALLKSLEEPPQGTYFLLVTHSLGRLIPTIRSRCRLLRFAGLGEADMARVLAREAPQADADARAAAIAGAGGSPGVALALVEAGLGGALSVMRRLLREGDETLALRGELVAALGAKPPRERLVAAIDLARAVLGQELRDAAPARQAQIITAHGALVQLGREVPTYNYEGEIVAQTLGATLAQINLGVAGSGGLA